MKQRIVAIALMAMSVVASVGLSTGSFAATQTNTNDQVCAELTSGKIDTTGNPTSVTITAPAGQVITGYCVKAGSTNNGNGPVYVPVNPPVNSLTITYPGGKDISHYSFTYAAPAPADVCPNIDGTQTEAPAGTTIDSSGNCVTTQTQTTDVCPNIDGAQTTVPAGMVINAGGQCVPASSSAADVCPNIAGAQATVPAGMTIDSSGNCVTPAASGGNDVLGEEASNNNNNGNNNNGGNNNVGNNNNGGNENDDSGNGGVDVLGEQASAVNNAPAQAGTAGQAVPTVVNAGLAGESTDVLGSAALLALIGALLGLLALGARAAGSVAGRRQA